MEEIIIQIRKDFNELIQTTNSDKDEAYFLFEERMLANFADYDKLKEDAKIW